MKHTPSTSLDSRAEAAPPARKTRAEMIEQTIEDAMRPYLGVLPPEGLQSMRDILEDTLKTHPVALEALDEMEKEGHEDRSGTRVRGEGPREDPHDEDDDGGSAA